MKTTSLKYLILLIVLAFGSCTQLPDTPAIVMTIDNESSAVIRLWVTLIDKSQPVGVDYGDGNVVKEFFGEDPLLRPLKGDRVIIYTHPNNIISFNSQSNLLLTLDVTRCENLQYLICYDGRLQTLDLSENVNLRELTCDFNDLTSLDLSYKGQLKFINCSHNKLRSLDLTACRNLESLYVEDNKLTTLDIAPCVSLERLYCSNNLLSTLDITKNYRLKVADLGNNPLADISKEEKSALTNLVNPPHRVRRIKNRTE